MRKIASKLIGFILVVGWIVLLIAGFMAYFVSHAKNGVSIDGLGRQLFDAPAVIRFLLLGVQGRWAGFGWFCVDFIIVWGWIGVAYILISVSEKLSTPSEPTKEPDWLIHKIEADLKTVELTKDETAVEGYKKELLELLQKHNIKPPSDIQKLLTPAISRPHSSDVQQ